MDARFLCKIFFVIFYHGVTEIYGQNARITAPSHFILKINPIEIDCKPAGSLYAHIFALKILKNNRIMVNVWKLNGRTKTTWVDSTVQSRATTNSPNLDTVSTAQLSVTIKANDTQCDDEAVYTCKVTGVDSSFDSVCNDEASKNVLVVVRPDRMNDMQVSPLPSKTGQYSEGDKITLSCTGTVGAYNDPPRITWCIQRSGDVIPSDLESDSYFRSISQSNAQVVGSGPTTSCQYERTSKVVYQVANTDTNTTFLCQITAPGDSPICGQGAVRKQKSIEVAKTTSDPDSVSGTYSSFQIQTKAVIIGLPVTLIIPALIVAVLI